MTFSADAIETEGLGEAGQIDDSGVYDAGRFGLKRLRKFARRGLKIARGGLRIAGKVGKAGLKVSRASLKIANKIASNPYLATALTIAYPPAAAVIATIKAANSAEERASAIMRGGNILKIAAKMAKQQGMQRLGVQARGLDNAGANSSPVSAPRVQPRSLSKTGFAAVLARAPAAAKLSRERLASAASPDTAGYQDAGAIVGTQYKVEAGDYPTKIATKLVKDANRWKELLKANPQKPVDPKTGNFKTFNPGEMLFLPASWLTYLGIGTGTPTAPPVTPGVPVVTPSMANATNLQCQMLLKGWAGDQPSYASPSDFGQTVSDFDGLWGPRSMRICASYQTWSNKFQGSSLTVTGELNQGTYDSLVTYASTHISGYTPPGVTPGTTTPVTPPGLPNLGVPPVDPPAPTVIPGYPAPKPSTPGIPTGSDLLIKDKNANSSSGSDSVLPLLGMAALAAKFIL